MTFTSYEELDPMEVAEVFGATLEEKCALMGITLDEFFEECEKEYNEYESAR